MNHERLSTLKSNLMVLKGWGMGGWGILVVGIMEGTHCMEHWVWCKNNEFCYAENKFKINKQTNSLGILGWDTIHALPNTYHLVPPKTYL